MVLGDDKDALKMRGNYQLKANYKLVHDNGDTETGVTFGRIYVDTYGYPYAPDMIRLEDAQSLWLVPSGGRIEIFAS